MRERGSPHNFRRGLSREHCFPRRLDGPRVARLSPPCAARDVAAQRMMSMRCPRQPCFRPYPHTALPSPPSLPTSVRRRRFNFLPSYLIIRLFPQSFPDFEFFPILFFVSRILFPKCFECRLSFFILPILFREFPRFFTLFTLRFVIL